MAYVKKNWKNRQSENPNRRRLTATGEANVYDVAREEGLVLEEGDAFSDQTMNDLENRIAAGFDETAPVSHSTDSTIHVTAADKTNWNSKAAGDHNHNGVYSPVSHNHAGVYEPANGNIVKTNVNATMTAQLIANGASAIGTAQVRNIYAGTGDMTAGVTGLTTGVIYFVYE